MTKELKYGSIELMVNYPFNAPTTEVFKSWKKNFFKLKEVESFDVYLTGSFLEKLSNDNIKTNDVDIILTGCDDNKKIEKLIYEGTKLGFDKYHTFFDILWFSELPIYCEMKKNEVKQVEVGLISPEFLIDGINMNKPFKYTKQISTNLWKLPCAFPSPKQVKIMNSGYIYKKPMLIK
tara:strand:+ start:53 stop:586 length:534 start_codon:yes stop_codon:yes gene_type:complete